MRPHELPAINRRSFLLALTAAIAAALAPLQAEQDQNDPFTGLSPNALEHARTNGLVMIHRPTPPNLSWTTQITKDEEPGERLVVEGQVFRPDGRTPAPGVIVYAYNTDAQGYYGENHTEYPPRIYGWMQTDASGRFELHTIRPGRYPGMRVPAHVHLELWGGGYPLQWTDGLRFEGDPYLTADMIAADERLGEFRRIQPLARGTDGAWHCRMQIKLQTTTTFR